MTEKLNAIFRFCSRRKSIIPIILIIFLFGSSQGLYPQNREDEYRIPVKLNDGWEVASLIEA